MKESLLTILRNKESAIDEFRRATEKLSHLLASDISSSIKEKKLPVTTPLGKTVGKIASDDILLVPILRSGISLLPGFLYYFPKAKVGFLGMKREEKSAKPILYFENLPKIASSTLVVILDPMIATAGSSQLAIEKLLSIGAKTSSMHLVSILACKEGLRKLEKTYPSLSIHAAGIDEKLNKQNYIYPGLGDFGDRFFGCSL